MKKFLLSLLVLVAALQGVAEAAEPPQFKELQWDALVPKGWDPAKAFRGKDIGLIDDSDPKMQDLLKAMQAEWDNAPTNSQLDGTAVKLPGYLVPLDSAKGELREFLLVPYFGACIHSPPPPANQIVHVKLAKPAKGYHSMDAVWVRGILTTGRQASSMGMSGYRMQAAAVERYEPLAVR
ncbi:MAG TPA: DUF3299 domain-containing protein [Burkholderiaceae bacterium]|nr:DUF3299 domain-containing protein [Burkholderiaceae bacterium]